MSLFDPASLLIVSVGVFAGAVVSGLLGFAFSAVAGAILLHVLPPTEAVPLMMACSIVTQGVSLVALRGTVKWRGSPLLIAGGLVGILPAFYLLHAIDVRIFRVGFGVFLAAYAAYMLLRPAIAQGLGAPHRLRDAAIGFGGGLIGGLTAMPGVVPTMWCELRGVPKDQQRALVQPYITAMQLSALAVMFWHKGFSSQALLNLTFSLPALAAGAALGVLLFRKIDDAMFRHAVLAVLFAAGLALVL